MNGSRRCAVVAATVLAAFAILSGAGSVRAEIHDLETGAFQITKELVVPGSPETVFDAMTGDILPWWDHSFSQNPWKLTIDPKPGGGFYEIFDESGDGVKHADVIYAQRGKVLRLRGPFGFSGKAIDLVHDFQFTAEGESTRIRLVLNAVGQYEEGWKETIDAVWDHFLVERFQAYMEAGGRTQK
jgi:uncharacterized protein YndB with AHSA1/START domain